MNKLKLLRILTLVSVIVCCGCFKDLESLDLVHQEWAGNWNSETQFLEIRKNGYGKWTSIDIEELKDRHFIEGAITIDENSIGLKEGRYETSRGRIARSGKRQEKMFQIDEFPKNEINDKGEPIITATLNGVKFIKDF